MEEQALFDPKKTNEEEAMMDEGTRPAGHQTLF